jgi:hypothetical protein
MRFLPEFIAGWLVLEDRAKIKHEKATDPYL